MLIIVFAIQNGISPLYVASQEGHTDIVDLLLKAGADTHQAEMVLHATCIYIHVVHTHLIYIIMSSCVCDTIYEDTLKVLTHHYIAPLQFPFSNPHCF